MGQHGPKMSSKRSLASIFGRFWRGSGWIFGGFGRVLEHFLELFYVRTPALSREAPAERLNARGSLPPSVLDNLLIIPPIIPPMRRAKPSGGGFAETVVLLILLPFGGSWGHVGPLFAIFSHFSHVFWAS